MQTIGDIFHYLFFLPVVNLLLVILHIFESIRLPGALGLSIITLSVLIRFLVWPVMARQLHLSRKMAELRPHLNELKNKHGSDKQALALAQAQLYKEHGVNPVTGCLPALIQLPVFWALFQSIPLLLNNQGNLSQINNLLYPFWAPWARLSSLPNPDFLGLDLVSRPKDVIQGHWYVILVPIITGLLQFILSSMSTSNAPALPPKPMVKSQEKKSGQAEKKEESFEDTAAAMQSQMKYTIPLVLAYSAFIFQIGLALYYNVSTILGIFQQSRVTGWKGFPGFSTKVEGSKTTH